MTEQENSTLNSNGKPSLKANSHDDNLAANSWLIYLSRDLGKVFRKSKNEIDMLVDSTKAAYVTTQKITKKMVENPTVKRYSPYSLAGNGVLFLVRSSGKTSRIIESGTEKGISKIGMLFKGEKKKKHEFRAIPLESVETKQTAPEAKSVAAGLRPKEAASTVRKAPAPKAYKSAGPNTQVSQPIITPGTKISKSSSASEKKIPSKETVRVVSEKTSDKAPSSSSGGRSYIVKEVKPPLTEPPSYVPGIKPPDIKRSKSNITEEKKTYSRRSKTTGSTTNSEPIRSSAAKKPATTGTRTQDK